MDRNLDPGQLGEELRALPYEKYLKDPTVNNSLQTMLQRIEQIDNQK